MLINSMMKFKITESVKNDLARGIKASLELSTIKSIKEYIKELRTSLSEYKYNNKVDEFTEYQIYKLCCKIDNTDIYDLRYTEIEEYINSLIYILDFINI